MTNQPERSPSPSAVGFPLNRRRFLIGGATALGGAAFLAACGDDDDGGTSTPATDPPPTADTADTADTATAPSEGGDLGRVTFGSNYSDERDSAAIAAAVATTGLDVAINTVDHNTYQENFNTYVQQPDDVMSWFAGYRMRAFANRGVVKDISDVWAEDITGFSEGFKSASSGLDGKQYFVPFYFYPWGVHYRKSLFEENGYSIPTTWDEFTALCDQMQTDGLTPLVAANDGRWPQMGMFDMLNLRINGYDYHVSLMGGNEDWAGDPVKDVFAHWTELLPYYQPDPNGRTWQDGANGLGDKSCGMFLLGTFVTSNFTDTQQDIIDDIDFFLFPEINPEHGQDAIEAPIDGFMVAAEPANPEGARALVAGLGTATAIDAFLAVNPSSVAAHDDADTSAYNPLQQKSAETVGAAKYIAQFLDRDTDPDFAANVVGVALADFLADPTQIDPILADVEAKKATYTFE